MKLPSESILFPPILHCNYNIQTQLVLPQPNTPGEYSRKQVM